MTPICRRTRRETPHHPPQTHLRFAAKLSLFTCPLIAIAMLGIPACMRSGDPSTWPCIYVCMPTAVTRRSFCTDGRSGSIRARHGLGHGNHRFRSTCSRHACPATGNYTWVAAIVASLLPSSFRGFCVVFSVILASFGSSGPPSHQEPKAVHGRPQKRRRTSSSHSKSHWKPYFTSVVCSMVPDTSSSAHGSSGALPASDVAEVATFICALE